jgi:hypothetical protein
MHDNIEATILIMLQRTPQWIRHDMAVKEARVRTRAEAALAAMIAQAIAAESSD